MKKVILSFLFLIGFISNLDAMIFPLDRKDGFFADLDAVLEVDASAVNWGELSGKHYEHKATFAHGLLFAMHCAEYAQRRPQLDSLLDQWLTTVKDPDQENDMQTRLLPFAAYYLPQVNGKFDFSILLGLAARPEIMNGTGNYMQRTALHLVTAGSRDLTPDVVQELLAAGERPSFDSKGRDPAAVYTRSCIGFNPNPDVVRLLTASK